MTYVHDMTVRHIYDIPNVWLEQCLAALALDPETAQDYANQPVGIISGVARPEYGPAIYDLQCQICEATWCGIPGDGCEWCEKAAQRQIDWQIDLLLRQPDIDPDDVTYEQRMEGWGARMDNGVEAGLITRAQADTAWKRALRKGAA